MGTVWNGDLGVIYISHCYSHSPIPNCPHLGLTLRFSLCLGLSLSVWYIRKVNSIARSMRVCSYSYDYCERYTSWLNDIPPKQKVTQSSHLLYW